MDIIPYATGAIAALSCGVGCAMYYWKAARRSSSDATPQQEQPALRNSTPQREQLALRNSAAFALSCYWSRYYEGWSLVLFHDASGAVRHVGCQTTDGTFFDACGYCTEEQISQRFGTPVTARSGEESDVQSLLGTNNAVLEAAEDLRYRVKH